MLSSPAGLMRRDVGIAALIKGHALGLIEVGSKPCGGLLYVSGVDRVGARLDQLARISGLLSRLRKACIDERAKPHLSFTLPMHFEAKEPRLVRQAAAPRGNLQIQPAAIA